MAEREGIAPPLRYRRPQLSRLAHYYSGNAPSFAAPRSKRQQAVLGPTGMWIYGYGADCATRTRRPEGIWHRLKDLNLHERFWRPSCYRYIKPMCGTNQNCTGTAATEPLLRPGFMFMAGESGAPGGTRTPNPLLTRQPLYRLSYESRCGLDPVPADPDREVKDEKDSNYELYATRIDGVGSGTRTHVIQLMRLSWHHLQSIPT